MQDKKQNTKSAAFIEEFQKTLSDITLPQKLAVSYTVTSILKDADEKKIYRLQDTSGGEWVLKCSGGIFQSSLKQEYSVLCRLSPPHFPEPADFFETDGISYLLRRYVRGVPLCDYAEHLFEDHPNQKDWENALLPLFAECCKIIAMLHALTPPIIHRDIKSENFFFSEETKHLVLIDVDAGHAFAPEKTRDTIFAGTYGNAAPEQFGFRQSDVRTDVYGLGRTFLSLLSASGTGQNALSPRLSAILEKAVSFEPQERYQTVTELREALLSLQTSRDKKYLSSLRKHTFAALLIGLLLGLSTGCAIGYAYSRKTFSKENHEQVSSVPDMRTVAASGQSLAERAGAKPLDLFVFQEDVDALLLAAYQNDADALCDALETLIPKLYAEPELMRNPPEDYSGYDSLPESIRNCSAVDHIRLSLSYRDQCLKNTIGSYDSYQNEILSLLRIVLYRTSDADSSCIYMYSHSAPDEIEENVYAFCLSDLLENVQLAIDNQDGFLRAYEQN